MGRSRMISDDFWDDPELAELTIDERCTLLLFLTCRQSNVIGIYRVQWRQVGAGSGWTADQILNAARNLAKKERVEIHEQSGWIWVKDWWIHNSLKAAFTGNVAKRAGYELNLVPDFWREPIFQWIRKHDHDGVTEHLLRGLEAASKSPDTSLEGSGGNPTPNPSFIPITTLVGVEIDEIVQAGVWREQKTNGVRNEPGLCRHIRERLKKEGGNEDDLNAVNEWRAHQANLVAERESQEQYQAAEAVRIKERTDQKAAANSYLVSLDKTAHADLVAEFLEQGATSYLRREYRTKGLTSKFVSGALLDYIADRIAAQEMAA